MTKQSQTEVRAGTRRCAIYIRKHSGNGQREILDSLREQRKSCEAYIRSREQEGWVCLPEPYDDRGCAGNTMDRPALKRLLSDVKKGKVDCVVVYKVDRLTREMGDFGRTLEMLREHGVSFISIMQPTFRFVIEKEKGIEKDTFSRGIMGIFATLCSVFP